MSHTQFLPSQAPRPAQLFRAAWAINRPLTLFWLAMVVTLLASLIGLVVDPRSANAAPGWIKPTKFALSFIIYTATFLWMLSFVQGRRRVVAAIATLTALLSTLEMGILVTQVVRGTYSHFNVSTPLDQRLFSIMGIAVALLWSMSFVLGVLLLFQRLPNPAIAWGIRLGVLTALIGMAVGILMLGPKGDQLARNAAGAQPALIGAHTVGAPDGGPGLPFVGWSTTNGDLRIPHFIGMHGMQVIPLIAFLLLQFAPSWLQMRHHVALVVTSALGYLGLTGLLTWQALRGHPLIAPDALTLTAFAALVAAVALTAGAVVGTAWRRGPRADTLMGT
jgi:hypothetical protein